MKKVFLSLLIAGTITLIAPFNVKAYAATNVSQYVDRLYEVFLQRGPDLSGKTYWQNKIEKKEVTLADATYTFINGPEFRSRNFTDEQYLTMLYEVMLNREPDSEGLKYWENRMYDGYSKKTVLNNFLNTPEFKNSVAGINANFGALSLDPMDYQYNSAIFMTNLYNNLLKRQPDDDGLNYWSNRVAKKEISLVDAFQYTINSDEYKKSPLNNDEYINALYKIFHNRVPDLEGKSYWLGKLNAGYSRNYILGCFLDSQELNDFVNRTSLAKGSIAITLSDREPDITYLVNRLYSSILNRPADQGGLNYWKNSIINNGVNPADAIDSLASSDELKNQNISSDDYVNRIYQALFNRAPKSDEMDAALNQMLYGYSRRYILYNCLNSQEFKNNMYSLGIGDGGSIKLYNNDVSYTQPVIGIVKFDLNLRTKPEVGARSADDNDAVKGMKITILERVRGDVDYYHVKFVKNNKILDGYVLKFASGAPTMDVVNDNANNEYLGVLSETYESGGNPGSISTGQGDVGGKSYGAWQLSSNMGSLDSFLIWLSSNNKGFFDILDSARKNDNNTFGTNFDNAWRSIASSNYLAFYDLQHKYIKITYYDKLVKKLIESADYDSRLKSYSVKNVLWSISVQHGVTGAFNIINKFSNEKDVNSFITKIYNERGRKGADGKLVYFPGCSDDVMNGVSNRLVNECNDALRLYSYEKTYLN